jgi:hypothetical protein
MGCTRCRILMKMLTKIVIGKGTWKYFIVSTVLVIDFILGLLTGFEIVIW